MSMEAVQSVVEIIDTAHTHRYELAGILDEIKNLENQINSSSDLANQKLEEHFLKIKAAVNAAVDGRLEQLKSDVEDIRSEALKPLEECNTLVRESLASTIQVMDEGASLLKDNPEENVDKLLMFKENPKTKSLSSVPAIPSPSEVACVNVVISPELEGEMEKAIAMEGRVLAQAPVQITDIVEKPGSLLVQWLETDEDSEIGEFWLQYAIGSYKDYEDHNAIFHTAYVGTCNSYTVKHLRTATSYTFRVCGRGESDTPWFAWSVPRIAMTHIPHYQWSSTKTEVYYLSNENKTATRTCEGVSHVLYSSSASFTPGNALTIKILDDADRSPGDGLAISVHNKDTNGFGSDGVIYINLYGTVYVDGQEITTKLPEIKKGSIVAFQTELLPNGKIIVSVENEEKEVTFDWKVDNHLASRQGPTQFNGDTGGQLVFYFAIKFSQENWKIAVD